MNSSEKIKELLELKTKIEDLSKKATDIINSSDREPGKFDEFYLNKIKIDSSRIPKYLALVFKDDETDIDYFCEITKVNFLAMILDRESALKKIDPSVSERTSLISLLKEILRKYKIGYDSNRFSCN